MKNSWKNEDGGHDRVYGADGVDVYVDSAAVDPAAEHDRTRDANRPDPRQGSLAKTCNFLDHRIWLNLELAKKNPSCLEYIVVHEMVHLLEHHHNERFTRFMDRFMPGWRMRREELNRAPLSYEGWTYLRSF